MQLKSLAVRSLGVSLTMSRALEWVHQLQEDLPACERIPNFSDPPAFQSVSGSWSWWIYKLIRLSIWCLGPLWNFPPSVAYMKLIQLKPFSLPICKNAKLTQVIIFNQCHWLVTNDSCTRNSNPAMSGCFKYWTVPPKGHIKRTIETLIATVSAQITS